MGKRDEDPEIVVGQPVLYKGTVFISSKLIAGWRTVSEIYRNADGTPSLVLRQSESRAVLWPGEFE